MTKTTFTIQELTALVTEIFAGAGLSTLHAEALAQVITSAERDACKSHGIYRIEGCLRTIKAGKVVADAEPVMTVDNSAIVRVDALGGFSSAAFEMGVSALASRVSDLGIAALVLNNCTHFSALWHEIELLTDRGLVGMAMCPSYACVAPTGGSEALLGTNPFAFGWPRAGGDPYIFDFATSVAARGEIELYRQAGKPLPEGWAIDATGNPTTDPSAALAGAMLPFGAHKGSAISTMIELIAGIMIGDATSVESLAALGSMTLAPTHGELILAFDPARFAAGHGGDPLQRAEKLFEAILGQGARLPSQRRFTARANAVTNGITLSADEVEVLNRLHSGGLSAID
ncbi:Ldh family oxidoreductase [Pararhodobacter oceanensis]|uniref:Oxidoreductase n=1 Tax=Pararhodobacter oceanensis TaxID=2172121 RepID=A0A2T8HZ93_9RHOB|nr:Ldh family oxidoreductase [Pararhodobacter oceanensis]PVH30750.1 oxidoreductase [Pararhodobacter oceanensis]